MTETDLADRCYWIASSAYSMEQSKLAISAYQSSPGIGNKVMEVYITREKSLKAMN
jgi:hypothetical protein